MVSLKFKLRRLAPILNHMNFFYRCHIRLLICDKVKWYASTRIAITHLNYNL